MTVTEYISLTIAGWETDSTRPQYTEYEQRRILRFSKTDTGALILQSDELPFQFSELSGPPIDSKPTAANTVFLPVISERIGDSKPSEHSNTQLKPLAVQANKSAIVSYALTWALGRNPSYRDFDTVDCTNFVSQAMYACRRLVGRPGFHAVGWGVVVQQLDNPDPHMD